jgi:aryl-alcohol dehydrogenase-like predicted oxidoreductase
MQYTRFGASGLEVSRICLGALALGSTARRLFGAA